MINIAVMGYGTGGSGVVEVINTNGARINQRIGEELNIKYVLDMKDFPGDPVQDKIIHDFETIVSDEEVQIVVEVMGGIEPAYTFVKRCLQAGKSVATSNKALVAKHGAELLSIAAEHNINFLFEASVGGGIPIIRPLNSSLTADEIAKEADFFCFGTNDLTQMTYGFSRDDAGKFLNAYYDAKIFENDPFAKLDQVGVGKLMKMAIQLGKPVNPKLHVGICGEHGGDPSSVEFCNEIGLDYVSCSPFRVPIARLAAAQAAIAKKNA